MGTDGFRVEDVGAVRLELWRARYREIGAGRWKCETGRGGICRHNAVVENWARGRDARGNSRVALPAQRLWRGREDHCMSKKMGAVLSF